MYLIQKRWIGPKIRMELKRLWNQSRMCGKGVGLDLFHSDSIESQSYNFDALADIGPKYGVERL